MPRDEFTEFRAFLEVARARSFTRAAARLGVTPSALSHTIKSLEGRLGVRLLSRTTRDVGTTAEGERLRTSIEPHFTGIADAVRTLADQQGRPAGEIRVVCTDDAVDTVFRPKLAGFLRAFPDIRLELVVDNAFTNIIESRFDAGVRLGASVARDMVAVRIGPDVAYSIVAAPSYFERRPPPQVPQDLAAHDCINYRLPASGTVYAWELREGQREFSVRVAGPLTMNNTGPIVQAALDGVGLAYVPEALVQAHLASGQLVEVLKPWCPVFEGYHLYYPNRRHQSPAFSEFVNAFRHKGT